MSKRAEELAKEYADKKLQTVDPELWQTGYTRYRKMSIRIMDGSDVEQAFQDGYEKAEKDLATTPTWEQPEVDWEKEYDEYVEADPVYSQLVNGIVGKSIARHFYELGRDVGKKLQPERPRTCKTCGFYDNNCPFIRGKLIPYPNKVCIDYTYSAVKEVQP